MIGKLENMKMILILSKVVLVIIMKIQSLKSATAKKLRGNGLIHYHLILHNKKLFLVLQKNDDGGHFSNEIVSFERIIECIAGLDAPVTSRVFRPAFEVVGGSRIRREEVRTGEDADIAQRLRHARILGAFKLRVERVDVDQRRPDGLARKIVVERALAPDTARIGRVAPFPVGHAMQSGGIKAVDMAQAGFGHPVLSGQEEGLGVQGGGGEVG